MKFESPQATNRRPASQQRVFRHSGPGRVFRGLAFGVVAMLVISEPTVAEEWTDLRGTKTIQGRMVALWGETLVLEMPGRRRVTVPLAMLDANSRLQARRLKEQLDKNRGNRVKELKRGAALVSAGAPSNPPPKPMRPIYSPLDPGVGIERSMEWLAESSAKFQSAAQYDMLPPSSRKLLDEMAAKVIAELGPDALQKAVAEVHKLTDALVNKENWILSHPRFVDLPDNQREFLTGPMMSLIKGLNELTAPDAIDFQMIADGKLRQVLGQMDEKASGYFAQIPLDLGIEFPENIVDQQGEKTFVKQALTGQTLEYEQVEGYWVPKGTGEKISEAHENIDDVVKQMTDQIPFNLSTAPFVLQPIFSPYVNAQSEAELHAEMDKIFAALGMLKDNPMIASMMQPPPGRSGANGMGGMSGMGMGVDQSGMGMGMDPSQMGMMGMDPSGMGGMMGMDGPGADGMTPMGMDMGPGTGTGMSSPGGSGPQR